MVVGDAVLLGARELHHPIAGVRTVYSVRVVVQLDAAQLPRSYRRAQPAD
jgi:hypothetical protein